MFEFLDRDGNEVELDGYEFTCTIEEGGLYQVGEIDVMLSHGTEVKSNGDHIAIFYPDGVKRIINYSWFDNF